MAYWTLENLCVNNVATILTDVLRVVQKPSFLGLTQTYKYMHRQWILIDQSLLKTIRAIGDKNIPSRGGEDFNLGLMNKLIKRYYNL